MSGDGAIPVARLNVIIARARAADVDDEGRETDTHDGRREEQNAFHARKRCQITLEGAKERTDG